MIELHPEIVEKNGKKEFVAIQEALADADDLAALRAAKKDERDAPAIPLDQVVDELRAKS